MIRGEDPRGVHLAHLPAHFVQVSLYPQPGVPALAVAPRARHRGPRNRHAQERPQVLYRGSTTLHPPSDLPAPNPRDTNETTRGVIGHALTTATPGGGIGNTESNLTAMAVAAANDAIGIARGGPRLVDELSAAPFYHVLTR